MIEKLARLVRLDDAERDVVHVQMALAERVEREIREVRPLPAVALVDVVSEPAGGMVPRVRRHCETERSRVDDELAGRRIEVGQQVGERLVPDVDVTVDEHEPEHSA